MAHGRYEEKPKPSIWVWAYLTASSAALIAWFVGYLTGALKTSPWTVFIIAPHPILALTAVAAAGRTRYAVKRDGIELSFLVRGRPETRFIAFSKVLALVPRRGSFLRVMREHDLVEFPEMVPRQEFVGRWVLVYQGKEGRKALVFNPSDRLLQILRDRLGDTVAAAGRGL